MTPKKGKALYPMSRSIGKSTDVADRIISERKCVHCHMPPLGRTKKCIFHSPREALVKFIEKAEKTPLNKKSTPELFFETAVLMEFNKRMLEDTDRTVRTLATILGVHIP